MSQVQIKTIDREEWQTLAAEFQDYNYRQCWDYGHLLARRRRATSQHICIRTGSDVLGLADVRIKKAPLLGGIAYISGGPLVRGKNERGGDDIERLAGCLEALHQHYVKEQGLILRIQGTLGELDFLRRANDCFARHRFKASDSGREYRTVVVDLARPLAEIRATLAQKWRNCLNKAQRTNPPVKFTRTVADFHRFADLFAPFARRKGFAADLDAAFFTQLQERVPPADSLMLTILEADGKLSAGHLSTTLGDTCVYLLGATSDDALKTNAAYLLQWHVIQMAHEKGVRWYDLGGIDPVGNPGVYHFKCGLGGVEMRAPGPFELVPDAIGARLLLRAEHTFHRLRGKRSNHPVAKGSSPAVPAAPSTVAS